MFSTEEALDPGTSLRKPRRAHVGSNSGCGAGGVGGSELDQEANNIRTWGRRKRSVWLFNWRGTVGQGAGAHGRTYGGEVLRSDVSGSVGSTRRRACRQLFTLD